MRSTFQMLVFLAYLAALGWGGWYVFSGQMIADRNVRNAPVPQGTLVDDAPAEEAAENEGETPSEENIQSQSLQKSDTVRSMNQYPARLPIV